MEINTLLQQFINTECSCGKSHKIKLPKIVVCSGAIKELPILMQQKGFKKAQIIADQNTYKVAGESITKLLKDFSLDYSLFVFNAKIVEPDELAVGSAVMHFDKSCDLVIGVGSGVINDISKIVANVSKLPYFIVGTAPSMDGYASATSSMSMDGLKVSLPSKCADVIIGDLEILKNAPIKMLQSGLGDMLAKYVSIAEWRISHEITNEYYCERVADLIRSALKSCVDNAEGLLNREENAVKSVFNGLVIGGVAMALAGVSRPASGVEHYFSHIFDMRGLEFGTKVDLHGIQCAVATNIVSKLYEKVLTITPDKEKAIIYAQSFNFSEWAKVLKEFLGTGANTMIAQEEKEQKYNLNKHQNRLEIILNKWNKICDIIQKEIPKQSKIQELLDIIGAPKTVKELGIYCDLKLALKATKDIRDKYVLSRLLWDLGVIEEFIIE